MCPFPISKRCYAHVYEDVYYNEIFIIFNCDFPEQAKTEYTAYTTANQSRICREQFKSFFYGRPVVFIVFLVLMFPVLSADDA